jgi:NAD(P)-dependent dehydrogenase (short-subunit alcohol dehydrogenase family)
LIQKPGGLLLEITDGTVDYNAKNYRISVYYDLAKVAVNRLAFSQGHELAPHGASSTAVTPGWMRSEIMLEAFGVTEATWRDALDQNRDGPVAPPGFTQSETPRFVGRGIAALAADPDRARFNQQSLTAADLSRQYGVTDVDGTQPDAWAHI